MAKTTKVKKKVSKVKKKTLSKPKVKKTNTSKVVVKAPIKISKTYVPKDGEKYMCEKHKVFLD